MKRNRVRTMVRHLCYFWSRTKEVIIWDMFIIFIRFLLGSWWCSPSSKMGFFKTNVSSSSCSLWRRWTWVSFRDTGCEEWNEFTQSVEILRSHESVSGVLWCEQDHYRKDFLHVSFFFYGLYWKDPKFQWLLFFYEDVRTDVMTNPLYELLLGEWTFEWRQSLSVEGW